MYTPSEEVLLGAKQAFSPAETTVSMVRSLTEYAIVVSHSAGLDTKEVLEGLILAGITNNDSLQTRNP